MKILCIGLLGVVAFLSKPNTQLEYQLRQIKEWIDSDSLQSASEAMEHIDISGASNYNLAQWYYRKAYLNYYLHNRQLQALKEYKKAYHYLDEADTSDLQMAFDLINNQGPIYRAYNNYEDALRIYNRALDICNERPESSAIETDQAIIYYNIGLVYRDKKEFGEAVRFFRKSYEIDNYPATLNLIGLCYMNSKQQTEAIQYFKRFLEVSSNKWRGAAYHNLANSYLADGDTVEAIQFFEEALLIKKRAEQRLITHLDLGALYAALGKDRQALTYLHQAKATLAEVPLKPEYFVVLDHISDVYRRQQSWDSAYHYQAEYAAFFEQFESHKNEIRQIDRTYQLQQIEQEVQNELIRNENQERNRQLILQLLLVIGALSIGILIWRGYWRHQKRKVGQRIMDIEEEYYKDFGE